MFESVWFVCVCESEMFINNSNAAKQSSDSEFHGCNQIETAILGGFMEGQYGVSLSNFCWSLTNFFAD